MNQGTPVSTFSRKNFEIKENVNQGTLVYSGLELFKTEDDVIFE